MNNTVFHTTEFALTFITISPIVLDLVLFEWYRFGEIVFDKSPLRDSEHLQSFLAFVTLTMLCLSIIIMILEDIFVGIVPPVMVVAVVVVIVFGWGALPLARKEKSFLRSRGKRIALSLITLVVILAYRITSFVLIGQ